MSQAGAAAGAVGGRIADARAFVGGMREFE
jgi:hypothetical protein